jgi:hypothetical protein
MIKFTSTLLKPAGDPKPDGCGHGCDFSPAGVGAGGFGWVPRVWSGGGGGCQTCSEPAPLPSLTEVHAVVSIQQSKRNLCQLTARLRLSPIDTTQIRDANEAMDLHRVKFGSLKNWRLQWTTVYRCCSASGRSALDCSASASSSPS